ncbi:hypothetical protein XH83_13125 [Bradyrhizobium sp. CCBAU 53351]|uniref:hypothetical protein n=1 Tax=Bradyrhizobium sp. CCBAU 53351 TaxID=1325114 RepID=UPI0018890B55|nr:hypothetical protein [Bradyrhizobium sp. CCBAU 53351]QOZ76304.1 hypothetical protein XH83_13125 [Bradyrhizobium sp. CCBAU 53351]
MIVELSLESRDIDIVLDLLAPRAAGVGFAMPAIAGAIDLTRPDLVLRGARSAFEARRWSGDPVASAVLALVRDDWSDDAIEGLHETIAARRADMECGEPSLLLRDCVAEAFAAESIGRAAVLLATLLHLEVDEAETLSALALCAARLGRFEEALLLANECLKLPQKHPRAYCIAGFCELDRGNRKAAQSLLAVGARIARGRPDFAEMLRAAQRVLLILHFA